MPPTLLPLAKCNPRCPTSLGPAAEFRPRWSGGAEVQERLKLPTIAALAKPTVRWGKKATGRKDEARFPEGRHRACFVLTGRACPAKMGGLMRKLLTILSVLALCLAMAGGAWATLILDTGPNPNQPSYLIDYTLWYAGQFTTNQTWNILAMQGYIYTGTAGELEAAIFTDNGTFVPDMLLFSKDFMSQPAGFTGWQGTTGFAGVLPAGTYWIAFTAPQGSTFLGGIGGANNFPPHPMA